MALPSCFDSFGRALPVGLEAEAHAENRRYFICEQPALDYPAILGRIVKHLGPVDIGPDAFAQRTEAILARLRANAQTAGIANGVAVPFLLPKTAGAETGDIGAALDQVYLPAVAASFAATFPAYRFVNHHPSPLAETLSPAPLSRHEQLLKAMSASDLVGVYFPCLSGFSVPAAREFVATLPEDLMLAGGFDTAAAFVGSPGLLHRKDGYPPLLWLAALNTAMPSIGFHFEGYGHDLTFNRRPHLNQAAEYWSSGLVAIG